MYIIQSLKKTASFNIDIMWVSTQTKETEESSPLKTSYLPLGIIERSLTVPSRAPILFAIFTPPYFFHDFSPNARDISRRQVVRSLTRVVLVPACVVFAKCGIVLLKSWFFRILEKKLNKKNKITMVTFFFWPCIRFMKSFCKKINICRPPQRVDPISEYFCFGL